MYVKYGLRSIVIMLTGIFLAGNIYTQTDTAGTGLKLDLGWTRNKNINLWPVFKREVTSHSNDVQVLAPLFRHRNDRLNRVKHTHLLPFFRRDSTPGIQDTRLITFYYPSLLRFSNDTASGIRSFRFLEIAPYINFFELSKTKDGTFVQNNLLFFILYNNNKTLQKSYFICFPLYWSFRDKEVFSKTFFPIYSFGSYYAGKGKFGRYKVITPFYWDFRDHLQQRQVFFPFIWRYKDSKKSDLFVAPFFRRVVDTAGVFKKIKTIVYPLFVHKKEIIAKDTSYSTTLFPVYWLRKNKFRNNKVVFPLVWSIDRRHYKSFTFLPFFSFGVSDNKTKSHFGITPFFWHITWRDTGKIQVNKYGKTNLVYIYGKKNVFFPLWWNNRTVEHRTYRDSSARYPYSYTDTVYSNVFFPVYWRYREKHFDILKDTCTERRNHRVIFPIYWKLKNPYYQSITFEPFFSKGHSPDNKRRHLSITPFYWHFVEPYSRKKILFPFVWGWESYRDGDTSRTKYILPVYWSYHGKGRRESVLFPLIWSYRSDYKKSFVVFPVMWYFKNNKRTSFTLLPLFSYGYSKGGKYSHLVITPLYWYRRTPAHLKKTLFPLWWYREKYKNGDTTITHFIFPFFYSEKNPRYFSRSFYPIFAYGHSRDKSYKIRMAGMLFWYKKTPLLKRVAMHPFFMAYSDTLGNRRFNSFYFLYRYKRTPEREQFDFLWPLCEYAGGKNYRYFRFTPVIWYRRSPEVNYFSIQPFYFHLKTPEKESHRIFWALFVRENYFNKKKFTRILWRLLFWERHADKDHEFRILHLLYAHVELDGMRERSILPFYHSVRHANGDKSFSACLGFYNYTYKKIPGTEEQYREVRIFWLIRILSNYRALKEKGIDVRKIR